ncbi:hypothetical protein LJC11_01415 [Bacteroidales bacterium OttesenSCG-928-I21]|nr:hypothetical protein [Bacteroidales bacterium OttesenSCG-928-I21]
MNKKEQLDKLIKSKLIGSIIEEVSLYNINSQKFDIKDCDRQVVDGGMEIRLNNEEYFCFSWDSELDLQNIGFDRFNQMFTGDKYQKLKTEDDYFWKRIKRQRIENVNIQYGLFENINGNSFYIPEFIDFKLSFNHRFLIGAMDFEIKKNELTDFKIDSEEWIVIFFDEMEINDVMKKIRVNE